MSECGGDYIEGSSAQYERRMQAARVQAAHKAVERKAHVRAVHARGVRVKSNGDDSGEGCTMEAGRRAMSFLMCDEAPTATRRREHSVLVARHGAHSSFIEGRGREGLLTGRHLRKPTETDPTTS